MLPWGPQVLAGRRPVAWTIGTRHDCSRRGIKNKMKVLSNHLELHDALEVGSGASRKQCCEILQQRVRPRAHHLHAQGQCFSRTDWTEKKFEIFKPYGLASQAASRSRAAALSVRESTTCCTNITFRSGLLQSECLQSLSPLLRCAWHSAPQRVRPRAHHLHARLGSKTLNKNIVHSFQWSCVDRSA